ncbi:MAG: response regulator transcription factor [Verrucomicrobia bacterium]|nr:response regulator transcription factor [Verrucomicrobiota bacterium]
MEKAHLKANASRPARSVKSSKARVLLVDDHPIVREGLTRVINAEADLCVCGQAVSHHAALEAAASLQPDVAVVDISLEGSHGLELLKDLQIQHPRLPVLILSMHDEMLYAERALRAGAKGYLMKREPPERLLAAIRKVLKGDLSFSDDITSRIINLLSGTRGPNQALPIERLSDRELQVLERIGQGHSTRQIAATLCVSIKTVQAHREHIKEKLEIKDGTALTRFAVHWVESELRFG